MSEKSINTSAYNEQISTDLTSEIYGLFRDEIRDSIFKVATKINNTITIYDTAASATGYADVVNGELVLKAPPNNGDITMIYTRRHHIIHPKAGRRFSASLFYDVLGDCESGFANINDPTLALQDSITLRNLSGTMYGRIFSLGVEKTWANTIPQDTVNNLRFDQTKGHHLNIQVQNDVGNIYWFLSGQVEENSKEVLQYYGLNQLSNVITSDPSMHGVFIVRNNGVRSQMRIGFVDLSNETIDDQFHDSVFFNNAGDVSAATTGTVLFAIYSPYTFKGVLNTRDCEFFSCSVASDKRADVKIYRVPGYTRLTKTVAAVPGQPLVAGDWTQKVGSSLQYIDNSSGLITGFDVSNISPFAGSGIDAGQTRDIEPPAELDIYQVHGETIFFVGTGSPAAANMNVKSLYIGESL